MALEPIPILDDDELEFGVCLWPVARSCITDDWSAMEPEIQHWSLALASASLHRLSGYRVGGCPVTIRPCKKQCAEHYGTFTGGVFVPHVNLSGQWANSCGCDGGCSCGSLCEITVPGPVGELIEVTVGTDDITADIAVQGNHLVYTGSLDCPFPTCQDMAAAPGTEGAFAVTYRNTFPVDGMAARAVGVLAMEFAKACTGKGTCQLPRGTKTVARQGVTIEVIIGTFPNGVTGIREVDAWIGLWRHEKSPKQPTTMWSPGMGVTRVT